MSEILIKDMEMPKKCLGSLTGVGDCPIVGKCKIFQNTDLKTKEKIAWDSRLPNCLFVELPEHGDLKDTNVILQHLNRLADEFVPVSVGEIIDYISEQPVVLEASE